MASLKIYLILPFGAKLKPARLKPFGRGEVKTKKTSFKRCAENIKNHIKKHTQI